MKVLIIFLFSKTVKRIRNVQDGLYEHMSIRCHAAISAKSSYRSLPIPVCDAMSHLRGRHTENNRERNINGISGKLTSRQ